MKKTIVISVLGALLVSNIPMLRMLSRSYSKSRLHTLN